MSFKHILFLFQIISFISCWQTTPSFLSISNSDADILLPPLVSKEGPLRVLVLVPGGLVPNNNYTMIADSIRNYSSLKLWVAIPQCLANLCDPLDPTSFGLNAAILRVIDAINLTTQGTLKFQQIFIFGHSLGGTGARHFIDKHADFAGLGLLGTQYIGDHEDFKGTLGYPVDLSSFSLPFLALTGQLDSIPFTHAARMFAQRENFDEKSKTAKVVVVIPKMDHSDFCQGFHVKGDIVTELTSQEAVNAIGEVIGSWLDLQVLEANDGKFTAAKGVIESYEDKTRVLFKAFLQATALEETSWCEYSQKILSGVDETQWTLKLNVKGVAITGTNFDLEHAHPNYTLEENSSLTIEVPSYPYYEEIKDFSYSTLYSGARDIACKMVSADRIASVLNFSLVEQKTCKDINEKAFDLAKQIVSTNFPESIDRFEKQGIQPKFKDDSLTLIGPQWVFLSSLQINSKTGEITSPDMYSPLDSWTYPGVRYCKVLSPARAVEYIMTTGLSQRYS